MFATCHVCNLPCLQPVMIVTCHAITGIKVMSVHAFIHVAPCQDPVRSYLHTVPLLHCSCCLMLVLLFNVGARLLPISRLLCGTHLLRMCVYKTVAVSRL